MIDSIAGSMWQSQDSQTSTIVMFVWTVWLACCQFCLLVYLYVYIYTSVWICENSDWIVCVQSGGSSNKSEYEYEKSRVVRALVHLIQSNWCSLSHNVDSQQSHLTNSQTATEMAYQLKHITFTFIRIHQVVFGIDLRLHWIQIQVDLFCFFFFASFASISISIGIIYMCRYNSMSNRFYLLSHWEDSMGKIPPRYETFKLMIVLHQILIHFQCTVYLMLAGATG